MRARMENFALIVPGTLEALGKAGARRVATEDNPARAAASQIIGGSVCTPMHALKARKAGETDERLAIVVAWSDARWEAPALIEAISRLSNQETMRQRHPGQPRPDHRRGTSTQPIL